MNKTPPKIIFLDIDGVLNNEVDGDNHKELVSDYGHYSERCVRLLNELTSSTGVKIVLSSTWRLGRTLEQIKLMFTEMGIRAECIGLTDDYNNGYTFRGNEILKWIKDPEDLVGFYHKYRSYVILDDDSDMLLWQKNNYVNCDPYTGITYRTVARAKAILNNTICEDIGQEFID